MARAWLLLLAGGAVYAAAVRWSAARLPAEGVALHIDAGGTVDRWGSRAQVLAAFGGLGLFLFGLGAVTLVALRLLPARLVNVPHRDHWSRPENLPRMRRMVLWDTAVIFTLPLVVLAYLPIDLTLTTLDPAGHGQAPFVVMIVVLLVGLFGYIGWMSLRRYRPGPD